MVDWGHHLPLETSSCRLRARGCSRHPTGAARSTACTRVRLRPACASCCSFGLRSAPGERPLGALRRVGAFVPSPRGELGCVQLLRRGHLSQAPKRLTFYHHLWLLTPSTTAAPNADSPGAARTAPPRLRSAADRWTEVITCHLRRPPVASALAALDGIRRGLPAAAPAPAHALVSDLRRLAPRPAAGSGSGSERPFRPLEEG